MWTLRRFHLESLGGGGGGSVCWYHTLRPREEILFTYAPYKCKYVDSVNPSRPRTRGMGWIHFGEHTTTAL